MLADQFLFEHHEQIRAVMREIGESSPAEFSRRRELLNTLVGELTIHQQLEDELFYPAVRNVSPLVGIAHAEHRLLSDQLAAVLRTDPTSETFAREFHGLRASVEHHATEEENDMFPEAHHLGQERLKELGAQLQVRQEQLRASRLVRLRIAFKRELLRRT